VSRRRGLLPAEARGAGAILGRALAVWLALVALALASLAMAYVPLGRGNMAVALGISSLKMLLIAAFFMRLRQAEGLRRLATAACLLWLAFLFALTFTDADAGAGQPASPLLPGPAAGANHRGRGLLKRLGYPLLPAGAHRCSGSRSPKP